MFERVYLIIDLYSLVFLIYVSKYGYGGTSVILFLRFEMISFGVVSRSNTASSYTKDPGVIYRSPLPGYRLSYHKH